MSEDPSMARCVPRVVSISSSQLVQVGRCLVTALHISGVGAAAKAVIYDGVSTRGTKKITVQAPSTYSYSPHLDGGILCEVGLYATVANATDELLIAYYPLVEDPTSQE
jgi:hypothetical protein